MKQITNVDRYIECLEEQDKALTRGDLKLVSNLEKKMYFLYNEMEFGERQQIITYIGKRLRID